MKKYLLSLLAASLVLLAGCGEQTTTASKPANPNTQPVQKAIQPSHDYHSLSNPQQVKVSHLDLDLTVDFSQKILSGDVELTFNKVDPDATQLVLDTRDLTIEKVSANGQPLDFTLQPADGALGSALQINLPKTGNKVRIDYHTSPKASGLQWLTAAQTADKKYPFLFSQAEAIHARSFIPLQDSPQVRVTYNATIHTPKALRAVMSAENDPNAAKNGIYHFSMPQPIPSYLIALAVGDLDFQAMGKRTGVYAEPSVLKAAAHEFEDTESMLDAVEKLYGPYRWGRYDLLILPPSFPFGGMENPRLSFITPTVIAGDKSLVSLIAHELAHSWSGNTVTNATWRDLWLNEGFTTYLTYRIMEVVYGTDRYKQEAVLGYQSLQHDLATLPPKDQILAIDLRGRDPDDVFSDIPYEKGALFLREVEQKVGRKQFDQFLTQYFNHFVFQSITTEQFLAYFKQHLIAKYPQKLSLKRVKQWLFEPGLPAGAPVPHSDAFVIVDKARNGWLNGDIKLADIDTKGWSVHQWLYFLNNMPDKLSIEQLQALDKQYDLTASHNNEIEHSWLMIAVKNQYQPAYSRLHDYLIHIGRNKLVKPLYKQLAKTPQGKVFAEQAFQLAKPGYHPMTVKAVESVLK